MKGLFALLALLVGLAALSGSPARAGQDIEAHATLEVPGDYPTISAAVLAAAAGDTILVSPGVYAENVRVNRSVRLVAENPAPAATLVEPPDPTDPGFNITATGASVEGFTVRGTTARSLGTGNGWVPYSVYDNAAIWVHNARDVRVRGNTLLDNGVGVEAYSTSGSDNRGLVVENNTILNTTWTGIMLARQNRYGTTGIVANNTIVAANHHGMWSNFQKLGKFFNNTVRDAAKAALILDASQSFTVDGLVAENVWQGFAIHDDSDYHTIRNLDLRSINHSVAQNAAIRVSYKSENNKIYGLRADGEELRLYDQVNLKLFDATLTDAALYLGKAQLSAPTNTLALESAAGVLVSHPGTAYPVDATGTHFQESYPSATPRTTAIDTLPARLETDAPVTVTSAAWEGREAEAPLSLTLNAGAANLTIHAEGLGTGVPYQVLVDGTAVAEGEPDAAGNLSLEVGWGQNATLVVRQSPAAPGPPAAPRITVDGVTGGPKLTHLLSPFPRYAWTYEGAGLPHEDTEIEVLGAQGLLWSESLGPGPLLAVHGGEALARGESYTVRVRVLGGGMWSEWGRADFRLNTPPSVSLRWPREGSSIPLEDAVLHWLGQDAEGDPLRYWYSVDVTSPPEGKVGEGTTVDEEAFVELTVGIVYYWRVSVSDGYEGAESEASWFRVACPQDPAASLPPGSSGCSAPLPTGSVAPTPVPAPRPPTAPAVLPLPRRPLVTAK